MSGFESEGLRLRRVDIRGLKPRLLTPPTASPLKEGLLLGGMLKLALFTLTEYKAILHLDSDVLPLRTIAASPLNILPTGRALIGMSGPFSPITTAVFLVRPSLEAYALIQGALAAGFAPESGWGSPPRGRFTLPQALLDVNASTGVQIPARSWHIHCTFWRRRICGDTCDPCVGDAAAQTFPWNFNAVEADQGLYWMLYGLPGGTFRPTVSREVLSFVHFGGAWKPWVAESFVTHLAVHSRDLDHAGHVCTEYIMKWWELFSDDPPFNGARLPRSRRCSPSATRWSMRDAVAPIAHKACSLVRSLQQANGQRKTWRKQIRELLPVRAPARTPATKTK
jgi:hypothetical protein